MPESSRATCVEDTCSKIIEHVGNDFDYAKRAHEAATKALKMANQAHTGGKAAKILLDKLPA